MATINLYKIDIDKYDEFIEEVQKKFIEKGIDETTLVDEDGEVFNFYFQLYYNEDDLLDEVNWNWIIKCFGIEDVASTKKSPLAILIIEYNEIKYAISFSYSHFLVDKYCDREFPYEFARRVQYSKIKTTALTNPNSQKNKTINTYIDYNNFDFDSGEALTKLKATIVLPEGLDIFTEQIEIGNSIKLTINSPTFEGIGNTLLYIINTIENFEGTPLKIPRFIRITDNDEINLLEAKLIESIEDEDIQVDFSEYEIHATRVIFKEDDYYELCCSWDKMRFNTLSKQAILDFSSEYNKSISEIVSNGKIVVYIDGESKYTRKLKELIYFTAEENSSIYVDGKWYKYNDDYLSYLNDSVFEIPTTYQSEYDYSKQGYEDEISKIYEEEKDMEEYEGKSKDEILKSIKSKMYKERYYNEMLEGFGYVNFDRQLTELDKHWVEVMDLYKDNCMFAVKTGNSSGKLSFAIDQSLVAAELIKKNQFADMPEIEKVGLWFVFDRGDLPMIDNQVDLSDLKMIILKNRLDHWKKEVLLKGYKPIIHINYIRD